ncbi:hypothetical protein [Halalkalibacterium ligniniphilum]|uniref:hypothetical protein n=1 Tax=Halalkalibacterium ligniniphilum TaxID=1134413 RepID=UPI0003472122|nr:hypothetical protein [Halalkalibacterium ligniniphilum]
MKKKKLLVPFILILMFLITVFLWNNLELDSESNVSDKLESQYSVDFFLTKPNEKPLKFASPLELDENRDTTIKINLNHNIPEAREYAILILEDYIQSDFSVEESEELINNYIFEADENSSNEISIKKNISPETRELSIIVIKKPNYVLKEFDLSKAVVLEDIFSSRHPIVQGKALDTSNLYTQKPNIIKEDENPLGLLFLSSELNELKATLVSSKNEKLYLSVANNSHLEKIDYVLIGLKDWQQYEFINGEKVLYTGFLSERERYLYEIITPNVVSDTNIQIIALPLPSYPNDQEPLSFQAIGTFRLAVEP